MGNMTPLPLPLAVPLLVFFSALLLATIRLNLRGRRDMVRDRMGARGVPMYSPEVRLDRRIDSLEARLYARLDALDRRVDSLAAVVWRSN
jgi:hypothetical protein